MHLQQTAPTKSELVEFAFTAKQDRQVTPLSQAAPDAIWNNGVVWVVPTGNDRVERSGWLCAAGLWPAAASEGGSRRCLSRRNNRSLNDSNARSSAETRSDSAFYRKRLQMTRLDSRYVCLPVKSW